MTISDDDRKDMLGGEPSTELASSRTAMAIDRTQMALDRTLMAVIRTALSLISFGFTIVQFLGKLSAAGASSGPGAKAAAVDARYFGLSLLFLGVGILIAGLADHAGGVLSLRRRRKHLLELHLLRSPPNVRLSTASAVALLLLAVGVGAVLGMGFHIGPLAQG